MANPDKHMTMKENSPRNCFSSAGVELKTVISDESPNSRDCKKKTTSFITPTLKKSLQDTYIHTYLAYFPSKPFWAQTVIGGAI